MKKLLALFLLMSQMLIVTAIAEEFKIRQPSEQEEIGSFAGGVRGNYLRLGGGFSYYDADYDRTYDLDYNAIGMDNYAPSASLAFTGEWGDWNIFFSASKGVYEGSFVTQQPIRLIHDDGEIPAGSNVDGTVEMGIYSLSGTYKIASDPTYNVAVGFGALILDYSTEFKTTDETIGSDAIFPMPYLALSGRKDINKFRFIGVGGAAYYNGEQDNLDYLVYFVTLDARAGYEFYKNEEYTSTFYIGYRYLYMDSTASKNGSSYTEKDTYDGPFVNLTLKYTIFE